MRMHEPYFPEDEALFIIWARDRWGRRSVAAGTLTAMLAAWDAVQDVCPAGELTLQEGSRVVRERRRVTLSIVPN